ncbi:serine/threonine protein kinase [Rubripirellula reticaptiva]|uniref:serine/threonine protein kinase n=1 Tax=Rubripirellula reticaptiva TaxID=2528013 RepID=UPI001647FAAA|nr:serine/threonine-protein kinase [Rubripirellula reticaptiva]
MSDNRTNHRDANERLIRVAVERQMITSEQATELLDLAERKSAPVGQVAIEASMMSPPQIEIAEAFVDPDDLAPGFRLVDVLGQGALGVVYRAHQGRLQRDVAIKAIMQTRLQQSNVLQRFQKESAAIGRLQHPNIVSAFDSGTHQGRVFLVMELVRGIDLRMRIKQGPIPLSHALSIVRQTASGLAHAASHEIIHRDIKPANLMLTEVSTGFDLPVGVPLVKIADFGLARLNDIGSSEDADQLTMTGTTLGTPMYCAPEQLTGDPVDHRADIYALGATLFSVLSGETPFEGGTTHKLIAAKIIGQPPRYDRLPENLPSGMHQLIADMMHHDPNQRIGDYTDLIRRIDEQMAGPDLEDTLLIGSSRPPKPKPSRRVWPIIAVTGGLVAAVIAVTMAVITGNPFRETPLTPPASLETVWSEPLFDGQSLASWTNHQSVWKVTEDTEGSRVLAGKGKISRRLVPLPPDVAATAIALGLRVRVNLLTAKAAEVQFAFDGDDVTTEPRWVVRLDPDRAMLGHRSAVDDKLDVSGSLPIETGISPDGPNWIEVQLQQYSDRWYVLVEGKPLGSFLSNASLATNQIQLVAIDGEAHFSDISTFGLEVDRTSEPGR